MGDRLRVVIAEDNYLVREGTRRLLEVCRTVPEVVVALIFVIAFGLGPMVGVLALASRRLAQAT